VVQVLGHQHLGQQAGGRDALVDDVWRHRRLYKLLAAGTGPLAPDVPLDGEHSGLIVQLLGHVFADALHGLAAAATGVLGFVADLAPRQVRRQLLATGLVDWWLSISVASAARSASIVSSSKLFCSAL
jgi:hypothetical protein